MKQVTINVHTIEQAALAKQLAKQYGYYLLVLGEVDYRVVSASAIAYHMAVANHKIPSMRVVSCAWQQLPFANESIDVLVLSHVLEQSNEAQAILLECKRVLRHDGRLLILGANPWRNTFTTQFKPMPMLRLKNMLQAANFVCVESKRFNFFKGRLLTSYLEKLAAKCLPALCSSYLLVVKKQIITLTPLPVTGWTSPFWSKKPVVPVALQRKDHG